MINIQKNALEILESYIKDYPEKDLFLEQ
jgi:hypothetical protein